MINSISAIGGYSQFHFISGTAEVKHNSPTTLLNTVSIRSIPASISTSVNINTTEMHNLFDGDIWVMPYTHNYDFSVIATPLYYSFNLYNSGKMSVSLNSLTSTNAPGTSIEGIDVPYELKANEEVTITIKATIDGDRMLDGYYTFFFDTQTIIFKITGTRAVVLSIFNIQNYAESETYQTDIFQAQNGTESRLANIDTPKRAIEYEIIPDNNQKVEMIEEIIAYALRFSCLQPLLFSATNITSTQNAYTISCDTTDRDFVVGEYALIRKGYNDYVMHKITAITATSITFGAQVSVSPGDIIVPLLTVEPESSNTFSFFNSDVASFSLKLKEIL